MPADAAPVPPVLVFDGTCGFCTTSVRLAQRWIRRMPSAVPYQAVDVAVLDLDAARCAAALQYVARDRRVHEGEDAVAALLLGAGGGWWLLGAFLQVPGVHWLSGVVYRWVAANRHRLPGGTPACSLSDRR